MHRLAALPLFLTTLASCGASTKLPPAETGTPDGPCAKGALAHVLQTTQVLEDRGERARVVLAGVAEYCPLPERVSTTIDMMIAASPADRTTLAFALLDEERGFAQAACPTLDAALKGVEAAAPEGRAPALYDGCDWQRLELLTKDELSAAWATDARGPAVLAHPIYVWLAQSGVRRAEAKAVGRVLAGM